MLEAPGLLSMPITPGLDPSGVHDSSWCKRGVIVHHKRHILLDDVLLAGAGAAPLLNAARLLDAAAQSQPLGSSSSSAAPDEAVHRRRQQAVMKSLKPFVALTGSMGQGQPGDAAEQQQLAMALVQQCQEQLDRYDTQSACGVPLNPGHWNPAEISMQIFCIPSSCRLREESQLAYIVAFRMEWAKGNTVLGRH
jgi:hypothetical protein